ncbi:MAG TPA: allose kinase [Candidatus Acutalibacter stercoravium]|nr:allose kinase [Candidatus Acutalibacter stercoravium]
MKPYVIGMDIGGTNLRIALGPQGEEIRHFQKVPREAVLTGESPAKELADFIQDYCAQHGEGARPEAVMIGFPATLDRNRHHVLQAPNVPGIDGLSAADLGRLAHVPVYFERDVNLLFSCDMLDLGIPSQGLSVGIYIGTGIGNAIFYNGRPLPGKNGVSGELGHIPRSGSGEICGCGNLGCAECFASGRRLSHLRDTYFPSLPIGRLFLEQGSSPILQDFLEEIACTVAAELNILDPEYLVLGGGVLHMAGFPLESLKKKILAHTRKPYPAQGLQILHSQDAVENGARGAVALAWALDQERKAVLS